MDNEAIKELLLKAHKLASTDKLKAVVEELQAFLAIQEERALNPTNEELKAKWLAAREALWANFDKLTLEYGITPGFIREQLKASTLFSGEHKELYDKIRKEAVKK